MKNILVPTLALILAVAIPAFARAEEPAVVHDAHEAMLFNRIQLEVDYADRHGGLWNGHLDGWIGGDVELIEPADPSIKVPHMGWNDVALLPHARNHPVLEEGDEEEEEEAAEEAGQVRTPTQMKWK